MDDSRQLVDVVTEIATLAAEPFDVELLQVVAQRVREVLAVDGVALFVSVDGGGLTWTTPAVGVPGLERIAEQPGSPCHAVLATGRATTFPPEHELLRALDVRAAGAVPLRHRDRTIGVLLLADRAVLPAGALADAQRLADVLAACLVREQAHRQQRAVNEQLQRALDARVVVEQAKGMIAAELGVDVDAALEALRRFARSHQLKLHDVAADVVGRRLPLVLLRAS